jgi:integrase/recombinase XerD
MLYKPKNQAEQYAHDFTVFSYLANGMNFSDIAHINESALKHEHFTFFRQKTKDTALTRKEIIVALTDDKLKEILDRQRKPGSSFIFGILDDADNADDRKRKINNFIQNTNRVIKGIAKSIGYDDETFSTYTMRHTFTSIMLDEGVPITLVAECLGHMSVVTTQRYAKKLNVKTAQSFFKILRPDLRQQEQAQQQAA